MKRSSPRALAAYLALVGIILAAVIEQSESEVISTYNEDFYFPIWATAGSWLNITDTTNNWKLSFNQNKGISMSLAVQESGNTNNVIRISGYLEQLTTGNSFEFGGFLSDIPFTWLRSVPDVKWVNIQNIFVRVPGSIDFNFTINYADFWTNAQASMENDKAVDQLGNCTRDDFRSITGGFLQSKPFWIVLQLYNGPRLTFPVPAGYNCSYSRSMELIRTVCN